MFTRRRGLMQQADGYIEADSVHLLPGIATRSAFSIPLSQHRTCNSEATIPTCERTGPASDDTPLCFLRTGLIALAPFVCENCRHKTTDYDGPQELRTKEGRKWQSNSPGCPYTEN